MQQGNPGGGRRIAYLVIADADPRAICAEFLDNLTEDEERAVLDFLADSLPLLRACREIEAEQAA